MHAVVSATARCEGPRHAESRRRSGESENEETRRRLSDAGVDVLDSNPAFDLTHEKSMVVDDQTAFVKSLNWETRT